MMVHKRFQYQNGLDIIAPLKHGTRWLEEETNPTLIIEDPLSRRNISKYQITTDVYWIYREPTEHLLSALMTEIRTSIEFYDGDIDYIINSFLNGVGTHWSPYTFRTMYSCWNRFKFKPIHLSNISTLFSAEINFDKSKYEMNQYLKTKYDIEYIKELIDTETLNKLIELSNTDKLYLDKILNNTQKIF
jgi:hypothetical protein